MVHFLEMLIKVLLGYSDDHSDFDLSLPEKPTLNLFNVVANRLPAKFEVSVYDCTKVYHYFVLKCDLVH